MAREDEWDEDETEDSDLEDENDDTVPCPYCRRPIHEDAQRCPHCENYLSAEDRPPRRQPLWILLTAGLCLLIVMLWILGG
jgi:predicted nucleic acid-binding Zn ribbon protein